MDKHRLKIALIHSGPISSLIPATSVMHGIKKYTNDVFQRGGEVSVSWVVSDENKYLFRYAKEECLSISQFVDIKKKYDLLINLFPNTLNFDDKCTAKMDVENYKDIKKALLGEKECNEMSLIQAYYIICGMTWRGEGYKINYTPYKKKTKGKRVGISLANANLRNYIWDNLTILEENFWYIPYKKNIFKRMDEINKCNVVITDDMTTFHLALSLRKKIYFLKSYSFPFKIEKFGDGEVIEVPSVYL